MLQSLTATPIGGRYCENANFYDSNPVIISPASSTLIIQYFRAA